MTTFSVVTTYADRHYLEYAHRCVESFQTFWRDIPLMICSDAQLESESPWFKDFKARHMQRCQRINNYRFDAVRFAHKVAAIDLAFERTDADVLIWMDADCVTHAPVDSDWLAGLLGDADFGYLRRARKYPECGFMMIRRNQAGGEFIDKLVDLYVTDELFDLAEWHDSWAIEHTLMCPGLHMRLSRVSLSGDAEDTSHPLVNGPLGARLDHCKGKRKQIGKSLRSDLKTKRTEAYWRNG